MNDASPPSRSALSAAVARGTHRLWDAPPWIVDDPFALVLVGPGWEELAAASRSLVRTPVFRQAHASVQVRSRYPEDRLLEGGQRQYVVLGAGLDAFAWRRPDLVGDSVRVFEVDHPATQTWKRQRVATLGLPTNRDQVFVPVNFETHDLGERLGAAGFDWSVPALFSWVGTTMYLKPEAIAAVLGVVARAGEGSEIVLSYNLTPEFLDDSAREFLAAITPKLADQAEPVVNAFTPDDMEALVTRSGLRVAAHPTADELGARYCAGRTDGLWPFALERLIACLRD